MNDFSDRIFVNYISGYCGDFIVSLINCSLDPLTKTNLNNHNQQFAEENNRLIVFKELHYVLDRSLKKFTHREQILETLRSVYKGNKSTYYNNLNKTIEKVDPLNLVDTFVEYARNEANSIEQKAIAVHYTTSSDQIEHFPNITFESIFPGSNKIRLTSDYKYHLLFKTLGWYKMNVLFRNDVLELKSKKMTPSETIATSSYILEYVEWLLDFNNYYYKLPNENAPLEDFVDVDVGNMLFTNRGDVTSFENVLSSMLKKEIKLDTKMLNEYKIKNDLILQKILGANYTSYDIKQTIDKLLEHFVKILF